MMKKILILMGRYLPGHRDGGPLRTIINVTEALGEEYEFHIAAWDRDHGDAEAYPGITYNAWNTVGKAKVWYVRPSGFTTELILRLAEDMDSIYLCSFYDPYGYKTLLLKKLGKIKCPVALASMGVFSRQALASKSLKKTVFITGCKLLGLFQGVTWSVTSELEAEDVKRAIGKNIRYVVAEDIPRSAVPGLQEKPEGPLKIVFLSRICEHKNLGVVIDVVKAMKNINTELTVCGPVQEEDYWVRCQKKLEELHCKWTYAGDIPSEQVQAVLAEQDVFVLPTKSENYGHVIFEALSVGCIPVISDRTPWQSVSDTGAGYVLPLETGAFTKALDVLAQMPREEREKMASAGVALAKAKLKEINESTGYRRIFG